MKNRFKFRVWDKIDKKFMSGSIFIDCRKGAMTGNMPEDSYAIQQCTGLKDKNGKLIFEGDILFDYNVVDGDSYAVVKWDNELAMFYLDDGKNYLEMNYGFDEVIGNIYEDKELLNGNERTRTEEGENK